MTRSAARTALLSAALLLGAAGASAQSSTQVATDTPIINFRLPTFTPDGYRQWLIRGSRALLKNQNEIEVRELALTIFTGDARDRIATMLLSPVATVYVSDKVASGPESIRVIDDAFEATGLGWRYEHLEKKVSLTRQVRVTIHSEFKDLLK